MVTNKTQLNIVTKLGTNDWLDKSPSVSTLSRARVYCYLPITTEIRQIFEIQTGSQK